ncbi:hypothetical protein BH10ACT7_BH10ACT7_13880 [soil metagenome]
MRMITRWKSERGSTMVATVAVMVITAVVGVSLATVTFNALATTTSNRASVQAQAAAESGIAATVAALNTSACQSVYTRTTAPAYSVKIAWSASATGSFTDGCPGGSTATFIRLLSTGTASTAATGGLASNRFVEAIYTYTPTPTASITPSGAALYSFSATEYRMTGLTLTAATTARPSVQLRSGKFQCDSSSVINGDVVAAAGNMEISNCTVNGNASTSGTFTLTGSGRVNGNVSASGAPAGGGYSVSMTSSSTSVTGNVLAAGPVVIQNSVGGSVTAGPGLGTSVFQNTAHIGGDLTVAGELNAQGMGACDWSTNRPEFSPGAKCIMEKAPRHVAGTVSYGITNIPVPTAPTVPGWTEYNYAASGWVGYNVVTLNSGDDCGWSWASTGMAKLQAAAASTTPTVLDARNCSIDWFYNANLKLNSNLVIIAKSFNMGNNTVTSQGNVPRKMWFIVPDLNPNDAAPTCNNGTVTISSNFSINPAVTAAIYTPCTIESSNAFWHGQMYSKTSTLHSSTTISYEPIGLPGVNLDLCTSTGTATGGGAGLGTVSVPAISYRDVTAG